jgi:hypothetical protein
MRVVLRSLRAFVAFWVDFVIGDDWTVAATIVAAVAATAGLVALDLPAWWLLPAAVLGVTTTSLRRAARRARR